MWTVVFHRGIGKVYIHGTKANEEYKIAMHTLLHATQVLRPNSSLRPLPHDESGENTTTQVHRSRSLTSYPPCSVVVAPCLSKLRLDFRNIHALCLPDLKLPVLRNLSIFLVLCHRGRTLAVRGGTEGVAGGGPEVEGGAVGDDLAREW